MVKLGCYIQRNQSKFSYIYFIDGGDSEATKGYPPAGGWVVVMFTHPRKMIGSKKLEKFLPGIANIIGLL